jgi:hypothetical protein
MGRYILYFAHGSMIECLKCGNNRLHDYANGTHDGFIIEPWWEELKYSVKNRECLCFVDDVVEDCRDEYNIIHKSCRFEDNGSDSGSEAVHPFGESEYFSDTQPAQTQETGSQPNFDPNADTFQDQASDPSMSDNLMREASPPDQRGLHRWGEVIPFKYWAEDCYKKYGGWRNEYERLEYYCFKCLALVEGWNAEYKEVCGYLEEDPEEAEADEPDSDESASD